MFIYRNKTTLRIFSSQTAEKKKKKTAKHKHTIYNIKTLKKKHNKTEKKEQQKILHNPLKTSLYL